MMPLHFLFVLVLFHCTANGSTIHPTAVQASISTIPQVHRRLLPTLIVSPPPPPSPNDDASPSSLVKERFHGTNTTTTTEHHDIAFLTPSNPSPMKHRHRRRTRSIIGTVYWGVVYTILFGGVIAFFGILLFGLGVCPTYCYQIGTRDRDHHDQIDTVTKKKSSIVEHPYRNGWWWWWWSNSFNSFVSSSDKTTSTDTTSTTEDSASIQDDEEEITNTCTISSRSLPHDDAAICDVEVCTHGNEKENDPPHWEADEGVDGPTSTTADATTLVGHTLAQHYLPEDDDVDHTIMVDVYRHYVYKGDDDDTNSYDLYL